MIRQLAHTCITTRDLDATVRFYHDILGLEICFRFYRKNELIGCCFQLGNNTYLECFRRLGEPDVQGHIKHFCLEVDDIEELARRLTEAGVEVRGKRIGADGNPQLWCTDPNGVDIEFQQYAPDCCQRTGRDCHVDW